MGITYKNPKKCKINHEYITMKKIRKTSYMVWYSQNPKKENKMIVECITHLKCLIKTKKQILKQYKEKKSMEISI